MKYPFDRVHRWARTPRTQDLATALAVLGIAAFAMIGAYCFLHPNVDCADVQNYYLPMAKALSEQGWRYLLNPATLCVSPVSFIYLSLYGDQVVMAKYVHLLFYALSCLAVFRTGWLLHSRLAGVVAAGLMATSPHLVELYPTLLTEPIFLFTLSAFMWALTELVIRRRLWLIPVAGGLLGINLISRSIFLYLLYLATVILCVLMLKGNAALRSRCRPLLGVVLVALFFPLAFIVKNGLTHGFWGVYSGLGLQFYYGAHPLTGGFEPRAYLGLYYDHDIADSGLRIIGLSPEGDRHYRSVAIEMLRDANPWQTAENLLRKTLHYLFISNTDIHYRYGPVDLREVRIANLALAAVGLTMMRGIWMRLTFATTILYTIAVHIPTMYVHRYSVTTDLMLLVPAGIGTAAMVGLLITGSFRQRMAVGMVGMFMLLAMAGGRWYYNHGLDVPIHIDDAPHRVVFAPATPLVRPLGQVRSRGNNEFTAVAARPSVLIDAGGADLSASRPDSRRGNLIVSLVMSVTAPDDAVCNRATLSGQQTDMEGTPASRQLRIRADGIQRWYNAGTYALNVRENEQFVLTLECPATSTFTIKQFTISEDTVAQTYGDRVKPQLYPSLSTLNP